MHACTRVLKLSAVAGLFMLLPASTGAQSLSWNDNFDDGDIADWTIRNPYRIEDQPVTLALTTTQFVSASYSLGVSGPALNGYSGDALGPKLPIDTSMPFRLEFSFRCGNFHWFNLVALGPVNLTLDYPFLPMQYAAGVWGQVGTQPIQNFLPANTWVRFRIEVYPNTPDGYYDVYIDNAYVGRVNYGQYDTGYRGFHFRETSGGDVDFLNDGYFDDLLVVGTLVWKHRFDYADMSGWTLNNPAFAGDSPITLAPSANQWVSPGFSLAVSGPAANDYSGEAIGPTLPIDITQPFRVEFDYRWSSFHWYHLVRLGPIALTMDYPFLPLIFVANGVWTHFGPAFQSYCPADQWVRFRIEVSPNPPNGYYDVYVDDFLVGRANYGSHDTGYRGFHLLETSGGNVDYLTNGYYDNLLVAGMEWTPTDVGPNDAESAPPLRTALLQNVPNPFNPGTQIRFDLRHLSPVRLQIFDLRGRLVRTLVNTTLPPARHEVIWNGVDDSGRSVPSGAYIYRLQTPERVLSRKMALLR